jgi:hypothetical protein
MAQQQLDAAPDGQGMQAPLLVCLSACRREGVTQGGTELQQEAGQRTKGHSAALPLGGHTAGGA